MGGEEKKATVELWQHNLYSSEQQLLCLMGVVAFANAAPPRA